MSVENNDIRQQAITIIAKYFGRDIAAMYEKYYANKPDELVSSSLALLLEEYLGKAEADVQLKKLSSEVNINSYEKQY
jgi:hypothetical protein